MAENPKVTAFLASIPADKEWAVSAVRELTQEACPSAVQDIKWNCLCFFKGERAFVGIQAYRNYVSVIFDRGNELADPEGVLEGSGKKMRHIKLHRPEDIADKKVVDFVKRSFELEG